MKVPATGLLGLALVCLPASGMAQGTAYEQLQAFSGVLSHVRQNYVDSVDFSTLMQASIRGMLSVLDPHSHYVTQREHLLRLQWDEGELAGPGLRLENLANQVFVVSVKGRAAKAGVQPGDRLIAIDDTTVVGQAAEALEVRLLGDSGSEVRLTFERGDSLALDTLVLAIKRERLEQVIVGPPYMVGPGTGYVRLVEFTELAPKELEKAIRKVKDMGAKQLILDLRGNPGGDLSAMVQVASMFLPRDTVVFRTRGRRRVEFEPTISVADESFIQLPLVLLIDVGTASAAEVLAGSFQDHDRALLLGQRSFGKGVMQSTLPLPNGDFVWLTTARILTPSGRMIQRPYVGLASEEYFARAGHAGSGDTTVYRTSRGRAIRSGGGVLPDVVLPLPPQLPSWFMMASDSGYDEVADSIGRVLSGDASSRAAWMGDSAAWDQRLVVPFLARVRSGLRTRVQPDATLRARIAYVLAIRAAEVRWGSQAAEELGARNDPDVKTALVYFPRIPQILKTFPARD